jgi:hypothetical protein
MAEVGGRGGWEQVYFPMGDFSGLDRSEGGRGSDVVESGVVDFTGLSVLVYLQLLCTLAHTEKMSKTCGNEF